MRLYLFAVGLILLITFAPVHAQSPLGQTGLPPIAAPLIREGELAMKLHPALGLGLASDEITAESRLGDAGIMPRNGWIADYPVTPDVVGELQRAVADAADAGLLNLNRDQALNQLDYVSALTNVSTVSYGGNATYPAAPSDAGYYPDATALNNYYNSEGPPIYTYFAPPDDYYGLYSFVPYPFLSSGFLFPGFFILRDFHRTVRVHGRPYYCSNHFRYAGSNQIGRIDPIARLGQAGASSTGVPYAGGRTAAPSARTVGTGGNVSHGRSLHGAATPSHRINGFSNVPRQSFAAASHGTVAAGPSYNSGMTAFPSPSPISLQTWHRRLTAADSPGRFITETEAFQVTPPACPEGPGAFPVPRGPGVPAEAEATGKARRSYNRFHCSAQLCASVSKPPA